MRTWYCCKLAMFSLFWLIRSGNSTYKLGCLQKLEGLAESISAVNLHPDIPMLITGSLDGIVHLWNSTTYKLENVIAFNLGAVYAFGFMKGLRRSPCEKPSQERGKDRIRGGTNIQSNRTIDPALQDKHNESKRTSNDGNLYAGLLVGGNNRKMSSVE